MLIVVATAVVGRQVGLLVGTIVGVAVGETVGSKLWERAEKDRPSAGLRK